jgi:hypothetical protein
MNFGRMNHTKEGKIIYGTYWRELHRGGGNGVAHKRATSGMAVISSLKLDKG